MRKGSVTEKAAWGNDHLFCLPSFVTSLLFLCLFLSSVTYFLGLAAYTLSNWFGLLSEVPITGWDEMIATT